jgi:glutaredoxin-related protein
MSFQFYDIAAERKYLTQMTARSGRPEIPQIFNKKEFCGVSYSKKR